MRTHEPLNLSHVALILLLMCPAVLPAQEKQETPSTRPHGLTVLVDGVREPVYKVGNGVKPPRMHFHPQPEYNEEARLAHVTGTVVLGIVVTSKGDVTLMRVLQSLGNGLDENAIEAVRTWKFKPATKDGKPVSTEVAVEVAFH
jgi:TonB family protein